MELRIIITRVLEQCAPTETIPAWSFAPALPLPGGCSSEEEEEEEREREREMRAAGAVTASQPQTEPA